MQGQSLRTGAFARAPAASGANVSSSSSAFSRQCARRSTCRAPRLAPMQAASTETVTSGLQARLPATHLESSRKALDQLKAQAINRERGLPLGEWQGASRPRATILMGRAVSGSNNALPAGLRAVESTEMILSGWAGSRAEGPPQHGAAPCGADACCCRSLRRSCS